jgi:hypothetical protein
LQVRADGSKLIFRREIFRRVGKYLWLEVEVVARLDAQFGLVISLSWAAN